MKRFWSIIIAVVMLFTVLALVSCDDDKKPVDTTPAPTSATTTSATTTSQTTTSETTKATTSETTVSQTTASETTASETTASETTASETTTPSETTATTVGTGTTLPLYARFDFGTESYAVQNGLTAHQFLMDVLEYDAARLTIDVKEDSWKIWVMSDWDDSAANNAYGLKFDSIITYDYDFPDQGFFPGWGTWSKYPYTTANVGKSWVGRHQYMKVRLINNTSNNMIGMWWSASNTPGYFTTLRCSNLYLQGATGSNTCTATTEYATYIYDLALTNALASNRFGWGSSTVVNKNGETVAQESWCTETSFNDFVKAAQNPANIGNIGANNYTGAAAEAGGVQFFFFGAVDDVSYSNTDSRKNAKQGTYVEVDYVLFGSTIDQLESYKSNIERAAEAE